MKKLLLLLTAVCICVIIPTTHSYTEDTATVRLARTIYAIAGDQDYETQLAIGTVIMNRVDSPWYPSTLEGVLSQQQQFPCGTRYDEEALAAAHEVLTGERTLDESVIAYQAKDASAPRDAEDVVAESGNFNFFDTDLRKPL